MPELADLPKEERNRLWKENYLKDLRHWQLWMAIAILIIWSMIVFYIVDYLRDEVFQQKHFIFGIANSFLGLGLGLIVLKIIFVKKARMDIKKARNM